MAIQPVALSTAHMEITSLEDSLPVLTDILGFQIASQGAGESTLRHPHSNWELAVHEGGEPYPDRPRHHHFGVRVEHKTEVDQAWTYLNAHRDEYKIGIIDPQITRHGSYSVHFQEPGTNFWEIECYEDVLRKDSGGERLGGVRSRHWSEPIAEGAASSRGFAAQAFTHGTLGCTDAEVYGQFAAEVLGLEVHKAYANVRYFKHPAALHFLVALQVPEVSGFSPNFRFTLTLTDAQTVEQAHADLTRRRAELGITDFTTLTIDGDNASFLLRDMNGNWWELAA
jgi:catechol 2,3-dioxygenase-like lactoylglutathione lyase family enzyme